MSVNQSRVESFDSAQYKKGGRSGNSGQQWHSSGGRGGRGAAHSRSSVNQSFSTNRRVGTGRGKIETEFRPVSRPVQNGAHSVSTQQGNANKPAGEVAIKSAAEMAAQRSAGPVTNAAGNSQATSPTTPAKALGDASNSYTLQFGTISPGLVNGMQIPARTSSAPPNLDEQKHDQVRLAAVRPMMTHPIPSVPKPQSPRKAGVALNQSNNDDSHRRESQFPAATHMPQFQSSPVHLMPEVSVPLEYHQQQFAYQCGVPGHLIPSQASMSMQLPMSMQIGQQMFQQPHQGLMHQNRSFNFTSQMNPPVTPQQQPSGKFGSHRKSVKVTDPYSGEELRFDVPLDSKSHSGAPQTLPTSVASIHTANYNTGPIKNNNQMHGIAEPSAAPHVTARPGSLLHADKVESPAAIGSTSVDNVESHKVLQQDEKVNSFDSQRKSVAHPESPLLPLKPVLETQSSSLSATVKQPKGLSSHPIQETASTVANDEGRSPKNLHSENNKGGRSPTHQMPIHSTSISDLTSQSLGNKEQAVEMKEEPKHDKNDSGLSLDSVSPRSSETPNQSESHASKNLEEVKSSAECVDSTISVNLAPVSESRLNSAGDGSNSKDEKPVTELYKTKNPVSKGKKKRKEFLLKADAVGASNDLYNAYKAATTPLKDSENTPSDLKQVEVENPQKSIISNDNCVQSKSEPDDWEDAEISTPKLEVKVELVDKKSPIKYSRDFLFTLSEQYTELPYDFDPSEFKEVLMVSNANNPMHGRNVDRGGYRTGSGAPVRDYRQDNYANTRYAQGGNYVQPRNPRLPAGSYGVGILTGPMMQPVSLQRNNSESERWQRSSSQKGLIVSPHTPMQIMHKAEKKYEVGTVKDEEQIKQRQLKAILNKLTPQNFEKLFQQVKDVNIDNANTLAGVISQIFDKALTEPTFCEMYADFCFHLSRELPDFSEDNERITFKRLLISKCQEEFHRGETEQEEANKADEEGEIKLSNEEREEKRLKARRRMLGNIRLIGELYKKRMLTERIMHEECIQKLLGEIQNPDEEDIEALCKLMSTIGEMIDHQKAKEHMDIYFERMAALSINMALSSRVRFMLKDSIDLRRNKWQQRRKVEGPKKIEEVHRDAAQERQVQANRLVRGPTNFNPSGRNRQSMDFNPRSNQMGGFRSQQQRGYANQDFRTEERNQYENRALPQRSFGDNSITLGPQGGLARGMSIRGQNNYSLDGSRRLGVVGLNDGSREDFNNPTASDKSLYEHPNMVDQNMKNGNRDGLSVTLSQVVLSEERLQAMSKSTIMEFYSAKDTKEVLQCVKDLNTPTFHPSMISLWIRDSFERKDNERDLLSKLLINLSTTQSGILTQNDFVKGFELILASLEDAINDAPKASEFLGIIFAKIILENVVTFTQIEQLIFEGGEERGSLVETGIAAELIASVMETIGSLKGESFLKEIRLDSKIELEKFRHSDPKKSMRLDKFIN